MRHVVLVFVAGRGEPELPSLEHILRIAIRADALLYAVLTPALQDVRTPKPAPLFPSQAFIQDAVTRAAEATGGYSGARIVCQWIVAELGATIGVDR